MVVIILPIPMEEASTAPAAQKMSAADVFLRMTQAAAVPASAALMSGAVSQWAATAAAAITAGAAMIAATIVDAAMIMKTSMIAEVILILQIPIQALQDFPRYPVLPRPAAVMENKRRKIEGERGCCCSLFFHKVFRLCFSPE